MNNENVFKSRADVVSSDLGDSWALLNLDTSMYFTLNPVGVTIWKTLMERPADVNALVAEVTSAFDVSENVCRPDIVALLQEMTEAGLVEIVPQAADA